MNTTDVSTSLRNYVVASLTDNVGSLSGACLIKTYTVMRRHGVDIVASNDNFVNIFVNLRVMDNTNMI